MHTINRFGVKWALTLSVALSVCTVSQAQNLIQNGSFETPTVPDGRLLRISAGNTILTGWVVESGNVDLSRVEGNPYRARGYDGVQCLDMDGDRLGTIYQDVTVAVAGTYRLSFGLSANTHEFRPEPRQLLVELRRLDNNQVVFSREYIWSISNHPCQTVGLSSFLSWECHQVDLELSPGQYRLRFRSLNSHCVGYGPIIDKVALVYQGGDACAFDYPRCPACVEHEGDVDENGCVDDADLLAVLFAFGQSGQDLGRVDVNCDQVVDDADLLIVLFNFGLGC